MTIRYKEKRKKMMNVAETKTIDDTDSECQDKAVKWFTVKGIGDYCMVSTSTVRNWIKEGKLSTMRLPSGHHRINIEDFRDFLVRNDITLKEELFGSEFEKKGGS